MYNDLKFHPIKVIFDSIITTQICNKGAYKGKLKINFVNKPDFRLFNFIVWFFFY